MPEGKKYRNLHSTATTTIDIMTGMKIMPRNNPLYLVTLRISLANARDIIQTGITDPTTYKAETLTDCKNTGSPSRSM